MFNLLRYFDNPDDIVILTASENQLRTLYNSSLQMSPSVSVSIYHKIEYKCEMLKNEETTTSILFLLYLFSLLLWIYRNTYHYPQTVTILHRLLTIPPSLKLLLMISNYMIYWLCPWDTPGVKMYLILAKILLNLISESIFVGILFSIIFGYRLVRSTLPVKYFVVMLVAMLSNYLVIFILMVFDQFHRIGTILYSILNVIFLVFSAINNILMQF